MKNKSLGHAVSIIYRHLQIHMNQEFSSLGFGSGQCLFFHHISKNKGLTQKELSNKLLIDKATTAKAVKKLLDLGYIRMELDRNDKRCHRLYLTEKGEEILPRTNAIMKGITEILGKGMDREEVERTFQSLEKMFLNLTDHIEHNRRNI